MCAGNAAAAEVTDGDVQAVRRRTLHYFDIVEPAAALEHLELELDRLIEQGVKSAGEGGMQAQGGPVVACHALCTLIKQECDAEVSVPRHCDDVCVTHRRLPVLVGF